MEPTSVRYRPDIDGLRALAILPVVWFHSGLPGAPGGWTGVNTFFVISGYLITLIIYRELQGGSFRFSSFYERRVRRIAPALLLVTAAVTAAAYALLLPDELVEFAQSAVAAVGMVSNIYFWRAAGYFAGPNAIVPLLHTWSLGVEEQFYLLFPLCLLLLVRWRVERPGIATLALASFGLWFVGTRLSPTAAFYLLPTRGWELMVGGALAVGLISLPARVRPTAGLIGIALLAAAATLLSSAPSLLLFRGCLATLGAALVIASGPGTPAGRLLSTRPLVGIGKISYSLYLWHWPIFVFLRHFRAQPELPPAVAIGGIALCFALSIASYRWIECPARRRSTPYRTVLLASGGAAALILLAAGLAWAGRGLPGRLPRQVVDLSESGAFAPQARICTTIGFERALHHCHIGPPGEPRFVLWGDSHAGAVSEGVAVGLNRPGLVISTGVCPPALGWTTPSRSLRHRRECAEINAKTLAHIESHPAITTVVLSAYWSMYEDEGRGAFWQSVQRLADELARHGKRVVVIAGIPDPQVDVPWASAIRARFGRSPLRIGCPKPALPLKRVTAVDVSAGFCRQPVPGLFADSDHVSRHAGLTIIAPAVRAASPRM